MSAFSPQPTSDQMIPAQRGGNVTLLCDVPNNEPVIIVEVIKRGETYSVLFWRNGTAVRDFQLLSFLGRVELLVENSIVKVIINNLTVNDPGDYKCKASSSIADHPARNITFDKWPGKTFTLIVSGESWFRHDILN